MYVKRFGVDDVTVELFENPSIPITSKPVPVIDMDGAALLVPAAAFVVPVVPANPEASSAAMLKVLPLADPVIVQDPLDVGLPAYKYINVPPPATLALIKA